MQHAILILLTNTDLEAKFSATDLHCCQKIINNTLISYAVAVSDINMGTVVYFECISPAPTYYYAAVNTDKSTKCVSISKCNNLCVCELLLTIHILKT